MRINMKKYILTKEKRVEFGITLFRIKANISFGAIEKGELSWQALAQKINN